MNLKQINALVSRIAPINEDCTATDFVPKSGAHKDKKIEGVWCSGKKSKTPFFVPDDQDTYGNMLGVSKHFQNATEKGGTTSKLTKEQAAKLNGGPSSPDTDDEEESKKGFEPISKGDKIDKQRSAKAAKGVAAPKTESRIGDTVLSEDAPPALSKWDTFAGGTGGGGKNSYQANTEFGEYHIQPFTNQSGRFQGYALKFATNGKTRAPNLPHGGLWHDLGTHSKPQAAAKAAQAHHEQISSPKTEARLEKFTMPKDFKTKLAPIARWRNPGYERGSKHVTPNAGFLDLAKQSKEFTEFQADVISELTMQIADMLALPASSRAGQNVDTLYDKIVREYGGDTEFTGPDKKIMDLESLLDRQAIINQAIRAARSGHGASQLEDIAPPAKITKMHADATRGRHPSPLSCFLQDTPKPVLEQLRAQWSHPNRYDNRIPLHLFNEHTGQEYFVAAYDGHQTFAAWTPKKTGFRQVSIHEVYEGGADALLVDSRWDSHARLDDVKNAYPVGASAKLSFDGNKFGATSLDEAVARVKNLKASDLTPRNLTEETAYQAPAQTRFRANDQDPLTRTYVVCTESNHNSQRFAAYEVGYPRPIGMTPVETVQATSPEQALALGRQLIESGSAPVYAPKTHGSASLSRCQIKMVNMEEAINQALHKANTGNISEAKTEWIPDNADETLLKASPAYIRDAMSVDKVEIVRDSSFLDNRQYPLKAKKTLPGYYLWTALFHVVDPTIIGYKDELFRIIIVKQEDPTTKEQLGWRASIYFAPSRGSAKQYDAFTRTGDMVATGTGDSVKDALADMEPLSGKSGGLNWSKRKQDKQMTDLLQSGPVHYTESAHDQGAMLIWQAVKDGMGAAKYAALHVKGVFAEADGALMLELAGAENAKLYVTLQGDGTFRVTLSGGGNKINPRIMAQNKDVAPDDLGITLIDMTTRKPVKGRKRAKASHATYHDVQEASFAKQKSAALKGREKKAFRGPGSDY